MFQIDKVSDFISGRILRFILEGSSLFSGLSKFQLLYIVDGKSILPSKGGILLYITGRVFKSIIDRLCNPLGFKSLNTIDIFRLR